MKLTDRIHLLRIDFEIAASPEIKIPRFVNVILILGDDITLVDTGVRGCEKIIFEYIGRNGRDFSEIKTVILSHSHPDHIGSAAKIRELTGCRMMSHEAEREWMEDVRIQYKQRPVPGFFDLVEGPVKIDCFLADGAEMTVADGLTLKIIHSPGHSRGLLNILFMEDRILFTGDSIPLRNDIPNYDDYFDLMKSINAIRTSGDYNILLASWTPPLAGKEEIDRVIREGEEYMGIIDAAVRENYINESKDTLEACRATIEKLGLPPYLANPITDRAFRSHLG